LYRGRLDGEDWNLNGDWRAERNRRPWRVEEATGSKSRFATGSKPGADLVVGLGRLPWLWDTSFQHPHMHPDREREVAATDGPAQET